MCNASLSGSEMWVLGSPSLNRDKGSSRQPEARTGRNGEVWSAAAEPGVDLPFVSSAPHSCLHLSHKRLPHTRLQGD